MHEEINIASGNSSNLLHNAASVADSASESDCLVNVSRYDFNPCPSVNQYDSCINHFNVGSTFVVDGSSQECHVSSNDSYISDVYVPECSQGYINVSQDNVTLCSDYLRLHKNEIGGLPSQMNLLCWEYYLNHELDDTTYNYLLNGIKYGFAIVDSDVEIEPYRCTNYKSVLSGEAHDYVNDLILKEISQGKYIRANTAPCCVHALGAVTKSDGSYRPITDCKRPLGLSINNYMDETFHQFTYCTVDQVADNMSQDCFMATVDISAVYRSVPILPDHWTYQAINWELNGDLCDLFDTHLCFGLRCAPYIFTMISDFISRTMSRLGYKHVINYIDDFLVYGSTYQECQETQTVLIHLLGQLGFYVSWKKCTSPSRRIKYLGIIFYSVTMELSVPEDKLLKLSQEMSFFRDRTRASKRQIQKLCGILSHCSKVIRGGRTFSRRVIDLLKGLPEGNPRIRITSEFRKDLDWWDSFASIFNGKEKVLQQRSTTQPVVYTDSCLKGYGLVTNNDWQAGYFNSILRPTGYDGMRDSHDHWKNVCVVDQTNINFLELVPVQQALERCCEQWSDSHVIIFSDNTQVVGMVNKGISQNKDCMDYLRQMFWISATNNIYLTARHIPGVLNFLPDLLSRLYASDSLHSLQGFDLCCRDTLSSGS